MNDIDYSGSGSSGFSLQTNAPQAQAVGMPGLPGMSGGLDFFARLAQRRMMEERRLRQAEEQRRQEAFKLQLQSGNDENFRREQAGELQNEAMRKQMDNADYRENVARAGQPLRAIPSGPGISGGYTPDTQNFSGIQREMFLPGGATASLGGLSDTQFEGLDPNSQQATERRSQDDAKRAQEAEEAKRRERDDLEDRARRQAQLNSFYGR